MAVLSLKRSYLGAGLLALGCFPLTDGEPAPLDALNFPTAVALSAAGNRLYVVNNDTDLQYNSGSLLVLNAKLIREHLPTSCWSDADCSGGDTCDADGAGESGTFLCVDDEGSPCGKLGLQTPADQSLAPGPCGPLELGAGKLVMGAARVAPFISDMVYVRRVGDDGKSRARLLLPARGDATLHWADVEDDVAGSGPVLACGQDRDPKQACDANHRRGNEVKEQSPGGAFLATEPSGIAVSRDGRLAVMGHQNPNIKASIFVNADNGPELSHVVGGLGSDPMAVAAVPPSRYATVSGVDYAPAFLLTYLQSSSALPRIDLLRYLEPADQDPYLLLAGSATVTSNQPGTDCRGIAIDSSDRDACEAECEQTAPCTSGDADCVSCLRDCALLPLNVYAANRSPSSLLIGTTRSGLTPTGSDDLPEFSDSEALRGGPADVIASSVLGKSGVAERRVFVLAFDSRFLYIYDPVAGAVELRIQTGHGPQGFVVDEQRGLGYIAHQTDSYIGVVDLDRRHATYGQILLNVGRPSAPLSTR